MSSENDYMASLKNVESYEGKWVAILDGKIICDGITLHETRSKFKKSFKNKIPTYDRIPHKTEPTTLIF